jgi:hypothetical protein
MFIIIDVRLNQRVEFRFIPIIKHQNIAHPEQASTLPAGEVNPIGLPPARIRNGKITFRPFRIVLSAK